LYEADGSVKVALNDGDVDPGLPKGVVREVLLLLSFGAGAVFVVIFM
jgi:hypothetical protein